VKLRFVKPRKHPILSEFCKNLTSITQEHINNAAYFDIAAEFKTWIGYGREEYILCSWGFYDKKQFESDCKIFELETGWLNLMLISSNNTLPSGNCKEL
jgi:3'-5' exoribonuclease 1